MDSIETWAIKIAAELAPDEVDLAPEMTAAYLAGGEAREQLYVQSKGGGLGGFGGVEMQTVLPVLLSSITDASSAILTVLCVPQVVSILAIIKSTLEIKSLTDRRKKVSEGLPEQTFHSLKQALDIFSAGLKSTGYSQDQCDIMAYRFMAVLLENPASAQEFIKSFKPLPDKTNPPKHKHK